MGTLRVVFLLNIIWMSFALTGCLEELTGSESGSTVVGAPNPSGSFDASRTVCDPFKTNSQQARDRGLVGNLVYLTNDQPRYSNVEDYVNHAVVAPVTIYLDRLYTPPRPFDLGFYTQADELVKTINNDTLGPKPILYFNEYREAVASGETSSKFQRVMELTSQGFVDLGTFDFVRSVTKDASKGKSAVFSNIELKTGVFRLEVKNISKHLHALRAEISLNGKVVLKPSDFCDAPPAKAEKQKSHKTDDDDKNEDGLKHCVPKKDLYADVTLPSSNTMTVTLYGNTHSRIQVSLKKKD